MADLGFDGKVAIITGAGGGLGRQHALLLAKRGALVVINDLGGAVDGSGSDASAAQRVVDEIKALGGEAVADHNSVATPEGGAAIVQTAIDTFGKVDIVVNNAGILRDKSFHNLTPDLTNAVLDVHLNIIRCWPVWQLRSGKLRRCEDGSCRFHPRARCRRRTLQHQSKRHCATCTDSND